jgi:hypothetical protein
MERAETLFPYRVSELLMYKENVSKPNCFYHALNKQTTPEPPATLEFHGKIRELI